MNTGITFLVILTVVILAQIIILSQAQRKRHQELKTLLSGISGKDPATHPE